MNKQFDAAWTLLNNLRGVAPDSSVSLLALYALLLKYNENAWEKVCAESPELSIDERKWLFNSRMMFEYNEVCTLGNLSMLTDTRDIIYVTNDILRGYERRYHIDSGILTEPFNSLLSRVNNDSVRIIFSQIMQVTITTEALYDFAESLVLIASGMIGPIRSDLTTNPTLAKLESKILACEPGMTLYDGFCGTGLSVNAIADKATGLYLRDMDLNMAATASILCILGGKNLQHVSCGDSLLYAEYQTEFDRIIAEPAFGVKYRKDYVERLFSARKIPDKNIDGEGMVVFHVLRYLKVSGMAAVLLPMGFLFKGGKAVNTRRILIDNNVLDAIIELPEGCLPGTYVPAVILILKKKRETDNILMIDAKSLFRREKRKLALITDEGITKIEEIIKDRDVIEGLSATPSRADVVAAEYGLSVAKYVKTSTDTSQVESIEILVNRYKEKQKALQDVEAELSTLRAKYIK